MTMKHERTDYAWHGQNMCTSLECDRDGNRDFWPCEWVRLVARLSGVPLDDIDAVEINEEGPVAFNIRMRPKPEMIDITITTGAS
jgi:hypothetical protein